MQNDEPNWDRIEQEIWFKNAKNVINELKEENPNIIKKIETYIWRFDYDYDEVVEKIYHDKIFAYWFSKEPRR